MGNTRNSLATKNVPYNTFSFQRVGTMNINAKSNDDRLYDTRRKIEARGKKFLQDKEILTYVNYDVYNITSQQYKLNYQFAKFVYSMVYYNMVIPERFKAQFRFYGHGFGHRFFHPDYNTVLQVEWQPEGGHIYRPETLYVLTLSLLDKFSLEHIKGCSLNNIRLKDFKDYTICFGKTGLLWVNQE